MPPKASAPDTKIVFMKALDLPVPDRLSLGRDRDDYLDAS
jgi:hypothetical protein